VVLLGGLRLAYDDSFRAAWLAGESVAVAQTKAKEDGAGAKRSVFLMLRAAKVDFPVPSPRHIGAYTLPFPLDCDYKSPDFYQALLYTRRSATKRL
jgi:hypothetical protein